MGRVFESLPPAQSANRSTRGQTLPQEERIHSDRRLPAITGLRIFAALAVYASHIGAPQGSPPAVRAFFESGYCGVTIFFVLSGFVLSFNYFEELRSLNPRRIYDFFVARFARVYPLYLLVLLYLVLRQHSAAVDVAGWWRHAIAIQAWEPSDADAYAFNGPAWSISVEFFLYATFPLLIPALARLRGSRALLGAAGAVALAMTAAAVWFVLTGKGGLGPDSAHRWLYRTPFTRLGDFVLGILAARLFLEWRGRASISRFGAPLATGAALLIVVLMAWPALLLTPWSWDLAYALPAVALIFGLVLAQQGVLARLLSLPAIVLLGEASYAFYLVHSPAIGYLGAGAWASGLSASIVASEAMTLGLIAALAVGLHLAIELPARKLLRRKLQPRERLSALPATE
jgi:peptidoglycan/LPS O-acetylase OafA/YrhL